MKFKNKIVYGLVLGAFALASCQKDEDGPTISGDSLTVDREEILVGPDRIHETVLVTASDDLEWVTSSSRFFVSTTPANGTGSAEVTFVIDSTLEAGSPHGAGPHHEPQRRKRAENHQYYAVRLWKTDSAQKAGGADREFGVL